MQQDEKPLAASPAPVKPISESQIVSFWSRVSRDGPLPDQTNPHYAGLGPCWKWTGSKDQDGYGRMSFRGLTTQKAHRIAWALHNSMMEPKGLLMHACDNPGCVNPRHAFVGSNIDNITDMVRKGRNSPPEGSGPGPRKIETGEKHWNSKLTETDVRNVMTLRGQGMSYRTLAARFNVGRRAIRDVISGKNWSHVTGVIPQRSENNSTKTPKP